MSVEYMRKYRATEKGKWMTKRQNERSRLRQSLAWQWIKDNRPDVAAQINEEARTRLP